MKLFFSRGGGELRVPFSLEARKMGHLFTYIPRSPYDEKQLLGVCDKRIMKKKRV